MLTKLKKTVLYKKATETVFGFVFTTILSVGLIGGSSYMLFGYQTEIEKLESFRTEFKIIIQQYDALGKMMKVANSMPLTLEQINTEIVTIGILKGNTDNPKLDESFVGYTTEWCSNLILELSSAKGEIKGFYFEPSDEFDFTSTQSLLVSYVESNLSVIQEIKTLVVNWESIEPSERRLRVGEIENLVAAQAENMKSQMSHAQQMIKRSELRIDTLNDLKAKSDRAYNSYVIKRFLSISGISLGIVMLILVSREFFVTSNPKKHVHQKQGTKQKGRSSSKKRG